MTCLWWMQKVRAYSVWYSFYIHSPNVNTYPESYVHTMIYIGQMNLLYAGGVPKPCRSRAGAVPSRRSK